MQEHLLQFLVSTYNTIAMPNTNCNMYLYTTCAADSIVLSCTPVVSSTLRIDEERRASNEVFTRSVLPSIVVLSLCFRIGVITQ